jgi:outer membrane lipoprotein SlyB
MRRQLVASFLVLLIGLIGAALAVAQETTTGSIAGQVVDAQGAPVPGATVTLTSNQGSKTFVTDGQGRFFAPYSRRARTRSGWSSPAFRRWSRRTSPFTSASASS